MVSKLREIVKDGEAWCTAVHGVTKSWTWLRHGTSAKHGYTFFPCNENFKIESLSNFQLLNITQNEFLSQGRMPGRTSVQYGFINYIHHAVRGVPRICFIVELCTFWPFYPFLPTSNTLTPMTTNLSSVSMSSLFYGLFFFFWVPCINEIIQYLTYFT